MSPITHGLLSWVLGERMLQNNRDLGLVTIAGLAPDLDSLGILVDGFNHLTGRASSDYYAALHHWLLHGVLGAVLISALVALKAKERARVFIVALAAVHLHILADVLGSRGPDAGEGIWPLYYLGPLTSKAGVLLWRDQWLLNGWQNVSLTVVLLIALFYIAWANDRSPLLPWASRSHRAFVDTLRQRFGSP